jgi:ATP-dependent DNA ligase
MEQKYIQTAINYKKNIAGKFVLVEGAKLKQRIDGEHFYVTRKIDGHLQVLFYSDGQTLMLNANGKEKANGLKCINLFSEALKQAGVKQAVIAAELYMPRQDGRPRCGDVATALADIEKRNEIRLAPFDIVELDGKEWNDAHYDETHQRLCDIFQNENVRPVDMCKVDSTDEVKAIYEEWVEGEGAEGLVVHTDSNIVWKVKPRHTIDAAVIGYTMGDRGVRDLMMAVRREDGLFQMFALGSTGLSDEDRTSVAQRLSELHVE